MAKSGVIADVLPMLRKKVKVGEEEAIRIYEVHTGKVYKELHENFGVAGISEFISLYAERIPEDELAPAEGDKAINALHFNKEPSKVHGVPFKFVVKPASPSSRRAGDADTPQGEVFKQTKERLEKRTGIKGKQFEKIKFAVVQRVSYSKPIYLNDGWSATAAHTIDADMHVTDDILSDVATDGEDLLGLDHVDRSRGPVSGRGDAIFIR